MQVFAVGKWLVFSSLLMQILGFITPNPRVGGLEQEVMYNKSNDFYSQVISLTACQK